MKITYETTANTKRICDENGKFIKWELEPHYFNLDSENIWDMDFLFSYQALNISANFAEIFGYCESKDDLCAGLKAFNGEAKLFKSYMSEIDEMPCFSKPGIYIEIKDEKKIIHIDEFLKRKINPGVLNYQV